MHIISKKALREFWAIHPDAERPLRSWYQMAKQANWKNFVEVLRFPKCLKRGTFDPFDSWTLCGKRIPRHTGQAGLPLRRVSRNQTAVLGHSGPTLEISEVRTTFPSADQVEKFTVFDIGGNKYRLITEIRYNRSKIYIRFVYTHKEYELGRWKK